MESLRPYRITARTAESLEAKIKDAGKRGFMVKKQGHSFEALQNVDISTFWANMEGASMIFPDLSQIEVRLLAKALEDKTREEDQNGR